MRSINARGKILDFESPKIMGILNVTPDSFYAKSRAMDLDAARERANELLRDGADIIDIGAYSSRPGAAFLSVEEELDRLLPVVEDISRCFPDAILSVDTYRSEVARQAAAAGAHIINDISGGQLDTKLFETIAELQIPYILMHMRGTPETMQNLTEYDDVTRDVRAYFLQRIAELRRLGVRDIVLDPGFGFAKTTEQNYELLKNLDSITALGLPVLGAISRKSMIYKSLNVSPQEALNGTTALHSVLLMKGVKLLRVHDVAEAKQVVKLLCLINERHFQEQPL